jgi:lysozyme
MQGTKYKISSKGLDLIKNYESLHDGDLTMIGLQPKMCPAGIWTVGYGRALRNPNTGSYLKGLKDKAMAYSMYPNLTESQAVDMLDEDCDQREKMVNSLNLDINQDQFDALVSFVYNVGFNRLKTSTLLKRIWAKASPGGIYEAFLRWNKSTVAGELKELPGLTYRRQSEAELFISGNLKFFNI